MFLLLPILVNYFSPVFVLIGNFNGFITGSFIIWGLMFISSIFIGRSFCSYICPYGAIQMMCDKVIDKKLIKIKALSYIRYLVGIVWLGLLIYSTAIQLGKFKLNVFYNTENYVSVDSVNTLITYYMIVAGMLLFSIIFGKRGGCQYICPMSILNTLGTFISNLLRIPALRLRRNNNTCIQCKRCNSVCPMSIDVAEMVKEKNMVNYNCINCGACAKVCPKKCIDYKFQK